LASNVAKKLDVNDCSFAHFTLILLLHYLVKWSHWTCCWRVASMFMRLRSCWRKTFWAHAVIKMRWY